VPPSKKDRGTRHNFSFTRSTAAAEALAVPFRVLSQKKCFIFYTNIVMLLNYMSRGYSLPEISILPPQNGLGFPWEGGGGVYETKKYKEILTGISREAGRC